MDSHPGLNKSEIRCLIAVLTGFKLGIHHLIAAGFARIESTPEFKGKTELKLAAIHLDLDHYINVLQSTLYGLEHDINDTLEGRNR